MKYIKLIIIAILSKVGLGISKLPKIEHVAINNSSEILVDEIVEDIFTLVEQVGLFYRNINGLDDALRIGGAWESFLMETRETQIRLLRDRDLASYKDLLTDMFFDEKVISGVWVYQYFSDIKKGQLDSGFLSDLKRFTFMTGYDLSSISTSKRWKCWGLSVGTEIVKYTDILHGLQAYTVKHFVDLFSNENRIGIIDLGSGFGGAAEKMCNMIKQPLDIFLVDIPLNLISAYAYLAHIYGRDTCYLINSPEKLAALPYESKQKCRFIFVPTIFSDRVYDYKGNISILCNSGSLSEMDYISIKYYLDTFLTSRIKIFIETNSNSSVEIHGEHTEIPNSEFPVPENFCLITKHFPCHEYGSASRYLTSIYLNRNLTKN